MGEFIKSNLPEPANYYANTAGLVLAGPSRAKWKTAPCEFHDGSDSMRINTETGAFICMAGCGARGGDVLAYHMASQGIGFVEAAKALGAWQDDGKPSKPGRPKPLPAIEALRVLAFESHLAAVAAGNIAQGVKMTEDDRARLYVAARRIQHVAEVFA